MLSGVEWQQPWWLLLAPLPLLLLLLPRRSGGSRLKEFIARHLWPRLLTTPPREQHSSGNVAFASAWLLATLALANPTLQTSQQSDQTQKQANIAIVLDISPSMRVSDVNPSRIGYSKRMLLELARQLDGQRVALIAFSANAYTVLPLTSDNHILMEMIEAMDPTLASVTGSNLSRALQLAQQALSATAPGSDQQHDGLVLLVSDGEIHDQGALAASRQLKQAGHTLFALGVGTTSGGPVPFSTGRLVTANNEIVTSHLERLTLQALAQAGGGGYADLRPEVWPHILSVVDKIKQPLHSEDRRENSVQLFPLLLTVALLLFIWNGIHNPAVIAVVFALPLFTQSMPSEAAPWDESRAYDLLMQERNKEAGVIYNTLNNYNGQIGSGVAAYRLGHWQQALDAFDNALALAHSDEARARAAYNRGNALVQLGRIDEARSAYKQTLFWQAGHTNANHNLTLLEQRQPKGGVRKGKSEFERQGEIGENKSSRPSGNEKQHENNQGDNTRNSALQQSLEQWRQSSGSTQRNSGPSTMQFQQQLNTLKEDYQTMLKQRFASEDVSEAAGLVVEKPW